MIPVLCVKPEASQDLICGQENCTGENWPALAEDFRTFLVVVRTFELALSAV